MTVTDRRPGEAVERVLNRPVPPRRHLAGLTSLSRAMLLGFLRDHSAILFTVLFR
jgi:hypothetical protein